ncbi:MAG: helix-hairpin-helix domain-containing protein [Bacteroidetes bacterium]|nr:helix-hairpin-helix domain-containing protein [Bacteroidota bacterium]
MFNSYLSKLLRNKFNFSRSEIIGSFVLINLMVGFIILPSLVELYYNNLKQKKIKEDTFLLNSKLEELNKKNHFNINLVNAYQIKKICKFNIILCRRIISYRKILGGYINKNQFGEIYNITKQEIEILKKHSFIDINFNTKKIKLKSCKYRDLITHPYINYKQASLLLKYKNKYKDLNSLLNRVSKSKKWIKKIKSYIENK